MTSHPSPAIRIFSLCVLILTILGCGADNGRSAAPTGVSQRDSLSAQGYDPATARALAIQSLNMADPAAAMAALEQATQLAPSMVDGWLLLASRRVVLGDVDGAFAALDRLAALGVRAPVDAYPPLQPLQADPRWQDLVAKLDEHLAPAGSSQVRFQLAEKDLLTEGVTYDPRDDAWYVSAVHGRKIVRVAADGSVSDFFAGEDVWAVFGLTVDLERRRLWATTATIEQMKDFEPDLGHRTALVEIDLDSGDLAGRYELAPSRGPEGPVGHRLNDVVLAADGTVYASDLMPPGGIYRLAPGAAGLERIGGGMVLDSPQGLALLDGDSLLVVADYSLGLVALEFSSGASWFIEPPDDLWLQTLDGLASVGRGELVAIQNGGYAPHRILRFHLDSDRRRITAWTVAARALPEWLEPTLGVVVQDGQHQRFVYVAASQWLLFSKDGPPDPSQLQSPKIMSLDLDTPGDLP